ncbi:DUF4158 domain-containing protein [Nonomuraea mesophila]|uniref:DUF4158 domain-containing protein n=1 Tax=Nonomuraea mesophila TaxID=2530382 RepID=A0A4R5FWW6_9ACTN|nr:DUF4158 domain-containing protein [Nonomuraea mesophila]
MEKIFFLDNEDMALIKGHRGRHIRCGFALQLVTVRYLGCFPADPLEVPNEVLDVVAAPLQIDDPSCVKRYTERDKTRLEHTAQRLETKTIDDTLELLDLLMVTELLGKAHREADKHKVVKHPRLAKASAWLAQAVEADPAGGQGPWPLPEWAGRAQVRLHGDHESGPDRQGPQTLGRPLESRSERLRHRLRRPPAPDHPLIKQDRDTPLTGHTPATSSVARGARCVIPKAPIPTLKRRPRMAEPP